MKMINTSPHEDMADFVAAVGKVAENVEEIAAFSKTTY